MLRNYLIIAWRNLWNNKLFSIINILGLSIGMTVFMLIMLYVNYELSYDKIWSDSENIYRVAFHWINHGEITMKNACNVVGVAPNAQEKLPEVIYATRFRTNENKPAYLQYIDQNDEIHEISTTKVYTSDSVFFKIFDIPIIRGDLSYIIKKQGGLVISRKIADHLFGSTWENAEPGSTNDPIGKHINYRGDYGKIDNLITGVMENFPANSHHDCEAVLNLEEYNMEGAWSWGGGNNFLTYIKVIENTNVLNLQKKLENLDIPYKKKWMEQGHSAKLPLQRVDKIHLFSNLTRELKPGGNIVLVNTLKIIAALILILAWINYINLSTARTMKWAREVGLRKIAGASRKQIITQFLINTSLLSFLSTILSATFLQVLIAYFNALINLDLHLAFYQDGQINYITFYFILIIIFVLSVIGAGLIPALLLSSLAPINCFKTKLVSLVNPSALNLRKVLAFGQVAVTLLLLTGTLAIFYQTRFMMSSPLGFNKDQMIIVENTIAEDSTYQTNFDTFKHVLQTTGNFSNISSSSAVPGKYSFEWNYQKVGEEDYTIYPIISMDDEFMKCYDLELVAGRNFISDHAADKMAVIINEAAMKKLGFNDPHEVLGQQIKDDIGEYNIRTVIGVIKDFHQSGLQNPIDPIIFLPDNATFFNVKGGTFSLRGSKAYISIRVSFGGKTILPVEAVETISAAWKKTQPLQSFNFFFLDEEFDAQYQTEVLFQKMLGYFTFLAIFIACTGIFGLSYYNNQQRMKEVGIRKSLGASVSNLLFQLTSSIMKITLTAFLITVPISFFIIKNWLQDYAYRMELTPRLFILPALFVFLITILTVGFQTIKTALANPVKALRYE